MSPDTPVHVDEIWRNCDPRDEIVVRVTAVSHTRVEVVDATTGKRPRSLLRRSFHESAVTHTGAIRRTGYVEATKFRPPAPTAEDRIQRALELIHDATTRTDLDVNALLNDLSTALSPA
jgi:hypothetical protein